MKNKLQMFNILFLSNMMEAKGVWTLFDACRLLKQRGMTFLCHYIGKWSDITESAFMEAVHERHLDDVINYEGAVYGSGKDEFWKMADVFVLPTHYHNECFPLVLLEAMQHHVACIATNEGGIPEIVDDHKTGFVVEKKDAKQLADKIQYLMNNPNVCKQMGEVGYQKYKEKYTLEKFEYRMCDILKDALECK
jgi:glycosyltransferase involved in cell wall biosynthesis